MATMPAYAPQAETAALLRQQQHYEGQIQELQHNCNSLQQRLKDRLERAAKTRQQNDK